MHALSAVEKLFRPGRTGAADIKIDWYWLIGLTLVLVATGIGLRDPWPADEPRFALVARDMVASGEWLLPRVGGEPYADKPPVFFWLIAFGLELTGSMRIAFLLPSALSALGCVLLVYDLARRLWNREVGLAAGLALLFTIQFVWQARQAQIDATLCFWTTLGLYGLLRHLLLGPAWRWYVIGWAAAGLGVITKGVGFLPLLVLIPHALLRARGWSTRPRREAGEGTQFETQESISSPLPRNAGEGRVGGLFKALIGPLAFFLAIGLWLVPMLLAARGNPTLAAYRDEILFRQTVDRYANAWHHREPFWYFLVQVIPWLWMPLTFLLPWLARMWRDSLRKRDLRIAVLLGWIALVVLFFSLSSGKRGVYVLPAVPAFALACAPYLPELIKRTSAQRVMFALAAAISGLCALTLGYILVRPQERTELITLYDLDPLGPLAVIAVASALVCAIAKPRRGFAAFAGVVTVALLTVSFWINPVMNAARSGAEFVARIEQAADPKRELGLIAFKEQYLLHLHRPVVHFGHARWREAEQEMADAARWLVAAPARQLVVPKSALETCFRNAAVTALGTANRVDWFLVRGAAAEECVARGQPDAVWHYTPPTSRLGTRASS
ncbi:MAG TPA: glycosyltransferase family 39 protein [Steroidobacter sp.]